MVLIVYCTVIEIDGKLKDGQSRKMFYLGEVPYKRNA